MTTKDGAKLGSVALLTLSGLFGCEQRPARFADTRVITEVTDRAPITKPAPLPDSAVLGPSDLYLRFALLDGMDPRYVPRAGDVNAADEVVASSWFWPDGQLEGTTYPGVSRTGPPVFPLRFAPKDASEERDGSWMLDARGRRFLLQVARSGLDEAPSTAAAVATRLVRRLGYLTPEVYVRLAGPSDVQASTPTEQLQAAELVRTGHGRARWTLTAWQGLSDLGATPGAFLRADDPNDRVPHPERRTLRAFGLVGAWLGLTTRGPKLFRDVFAKDHVVHWVADLSGALGVAEAQRRRDGSDVYEDEDFGDPLQQLWTLGFHSAPPEVPVGSLWPGAFDRVVRARDQRLSPPLEAVAHAGPDDAYWVAKRMAAIGESELRSAVESAQLSRIEVADWLVGTLLARRDVLVAVALSNVTPWEVVGTERGALVMEDAAVLLGLADPKTTSLRVEFVGRDGALLARSEVQHLQGARAVLPIPEAVRGAGYAVVLVTVLRRGKAAPRPVEVHVVMDGKGTRVVGIRH
jgi:hypothetical protein